MLGLSDSMSVALGGYDLVLRNVGDVDGPNYAAQRAAIDVDPAGDSRSASGRARAPLLPRQRPDHLPRGDLRARP